MERLKRWLGPDGARDRADSLRHMLTALIVMLAMVLAVFVFDVPNPNMLLITGLAVFTSLYGYGAGIVCGAVMILYSMYYFSTDHSFFVYTTLNLRKIAVIVLGVVLNTAFIGNLKRRQSEAARKLLETNALLAHDNHRLEAATATDTLTGARNRFALRRDYGRFENHDVHVMMLGLDEFKNVNDRYGRDAGDSILRQVGRALVDGFGEAFCYRYGGDEFLVIVPDLSESDFLARLETLRQRLRDAEFEPAELPVHYSVGYVYGLCELSYDLRLMMHQADSNLYDAKGLGKDCCVGRAFSRAFAESLPENADGFGEEDGE